MARKLKQMSMADAAYSRKACMQDENTGGSSHQGAPLSLLAATIPPSLSNLRFSLCICTATSAQAFDGGLCMLACPILRSQHSKSFMHVTAHYRTKYC